MAASGDAITKRMGQLVQVVKANAKEDFLTQFADLKSDEDRVKFIWKEEAFHGVTELEPEYCAKSTMDAREFRQKGNAYFQKKAYLSAVGEYNRSIVKAPAGCTSDVEENELALAYANRSAALFHLNKLRACLVDIEMGFTEGYPKNMAYKLYDRMGKCHAQLGQKEECISSFTKAQSSLSDATLEEKYLAIWQKNLKNQLEISAGMEEKRTEVVNQSTVPAVRGKVNENYPKSSASVSVRYSEKQGRHVVAADDVRLGDVIMVDSPYASVVFPDFYSSHCYRCAERVSIPYPCPSCSSVVFCSPSCRQCALEKYHKLECQYQAVLDQTLNGKFGHLALRLVMDQGLERVMEMANEWIQEPDETIKAQVEQSKGNIYMGQHKDVWSLDTGSQRRSPSNLLDMTVFAGFLLKVLKATGFIKCNNFEELVGRLGAVVMKHLQVVQCNAFRITELQKPSCFDDPKPEHVGIAIYPTAAMLNHSCDPVADVSYYGNKLVVRALRNIETGKEVTCSYGPIFYDMTKAKRAPVLLENYFFPCKCQACLEFWPCWQELENMQPEWLCEACGRKLICDDIEETRYAKCKACSHRQNLEESINLLGISHDEYSKCMAEALSGHIENALPGLARHMMLLQKYMMQPWRDFTACQVAIKQCFQLMGNKKP